jgi:hypothetical protein
MTLKIQKEIKIVLSFLRQFNMRVFLKVLLIC